MRIDIKTLCGIHAVTASDGEKVLLRIKPQIESGESVTLDFTGVDIVNITFFNSALTPLLELRAVDEVKEILKIVHLPSKTLEDLPVAVLDKAWRMKTDPEYRQKVNEGVASSMRGGQ